MRVAMMTVRDVGMVVRQRRVPVRMAVRLGEGFVVRMLVMLVMHMQVIVL